MPAHDPASANPITALKGFSAGVRQDPAKVVNPLFFAARNGAIERVLRSLEHHFQDQELAVRARWEETSMPGVSIKLVLTDKRTGEHERRLWLKRDSVAPDSAFGSTLVYSLDKVVAGAYYGGRKPKIADAFDGVLTAPDFEAFAHRLISGVNYPFTHESHSSF